MGRDDRVWDPRQMEWMSLSNLPVVVGVFALVSWLLVSNGIYVDGRWECGIMLNPLNYISSMFLHFHWGHFASNMQLWLPIGTVFTLLTSNRHVLLVGVVSHVLTQVVSSALFRFGFGLSIVVFAVMTAALVRSIRVAFQNQSLEALQSAVAILVVPVLTGVFLVMVIAGPSWIGHFEHFLGALFGAAIEMMYVFSTTESATSDRNVPGRLLG